MQRIRSPVGRHVALPDGLYQVATERLCAGFVVSQGRVIACAPILRKRLDYWATVARKIDREVQP